jgi:hypothetical protein
MAELVLFKPRRDVDAEKNLEEFVWHCRERLTVFGSDLVFDEDSWNVTKWISLRGKGKSQLRAVFSSWAGGTETATSSIPEPFRSFAKAYFRYQHALRPTKVIGFRLAALRALCAALGERGTSAPFHADAGVFNRASQLIATHFAGEAAYRVGGQLEMIAELMDNNRLGALPLMWRNPLKRPSTGTARVGVEFDARREEKLPSAYALDSLARAFRAASDPVDLVVTSVAAILCSAPDRVSEVLCLRENCEVRQKKGADGAIAYGLRFWPSKGADPMVKWIVPSMASIVEEALNRIRGATKEAREVAAWYEANPTALFLPSQLEHLRRKAVWTREEIGAALFVRPMSVNAVTAWCKTNDVPLEKRGSGNYVANFADVERAILKLMPERFPVLDVETGLRFSQALCVVRRHELNGSKTTYRCVVDAITQGFVATGLGNRSEHGFGSIFERLGLFEADGTPIAIRSHQFRHYLNTLAQNGGLSELDIAKWSGRKDIGQNSAYNHMSDRDVQSRLTELIEGEARARGKEMVVARVNIVPRAKFAEMGIQAAHTTDFGFCAHDYALSPCQVHMDCINCNEQVCIKGDEIGEMNLRANLNEVQMLLLEAEVAETEKAYGATRWVRHQRVAHERLTQLLGILEDPRVPRGAVIRLRHIKGASRLEHAVDARKLISEEAIPALLAWSVVEEEALE